MAKATFKCPKCGNTKEITFTVGTDAESVCDKCGTKMTRVWKNISTGTVVDSINRLFNFGGSSGVSSSMPFQLVLNTVALDAGSYTVKVLQNPESATLCTVTGTFTNMTLSVTHF